VEKKPAGKKQQHTRSRKPDTAHANGALHGVRVLDLTWAGPGPFCSTMLGDAGADIIKIHEPYPERRGGTIVYTFLDKATFPGLRNCRTMGIDLKSEEGRGIFLDMVKGADVIMESFRPGVVERLRIDYKLIHKRNPRIVYASLTGYGQDGPYRDLVGHDINYVSVGGLLGLTGAVGGPPVIPGVPVADFAAGGLSAAFAIAAALMQRERTGGGQYIDVSLTDAVVGVLSIWLNPYLLWGMAAQRGEAWLTGYWPWYNVYETKDGKYVSVGALEPWFYANLCKLLGHGEFIEHQYAEGEKREEIFRAFRETFKTKTRDEWLEILHREDTCTAPVHTLEEIASDPQVLARGMIADLPHPDLGSVRQVGSMLKMSGSPFRVRNWATGFGQHSEEILRELGYDQSRIKSLQEAEVIQ